jgi:hypothetical protein
MNRLLWLLLVAVPLRAQDPQRYAADVATLAAPKMEGRGAGTKGLDRARELVKQRFAALGLQPAGVNSTYLQPFTVTTGARLRRNNRLQLTSGSAKASLRLNEDYVPLSFSMSGKVSGPVVFAGYGITAPQQGYDDYFHLDVKDKVVLVLRYEPPKLTQNGIRTEHSHLINKAINARNHGAKAIIIVNGKLEPKEEDVLTRFGAQAGPEDAGILMVQAKNAVADLLLQPSGSVLTALQQKIDDTGSPQSASLKDATVALEIDLERTRTQVSNVIGYLPGKTDEYVVIGAHYDHLGRGNASSLAPSQIGTVHPGADDNASGTAGVLELARLLSTEKKRRDRGVLFIAFAGEEIGLLGSAEWTNHPTRPLDKAVAMLNMDMVGRIKDDRVFIGGLGSGSNFKSYFDKVNATTNLKLEASAAGFGASDHISFIAHQVPSLFFFSGLHSDYHKPSDTAGKIDAASASKLLALVRALADELSDGERAKFIRVDEKRPLSSASGGGYGPWFGSVPDFGENPNGVKFADVSAGSPAEKAGLKASDILIRFGEHPVKNLYDFTFALRQHKIGDEVEVTVLRDGKPLMVKVTLAQRR